MNIKKIVLHWIFMFTFAISMSSNSFAGDFFKDSKRGWFWYETKPEQKEQAAQVKKDNSNSVSHNDAQEKLKNFQEQLEERKAQMIMYPSIENTQKFLSIQNQLFERASLVAKYGQLAVLSKPELNIAREQPISHAALTIAREEQSKKEHLFISSFAKEYKLLFFYSSKCIFCKKFSYVLEHFAKKYGFKVASVTLDGKQLPNFPAFYNQRLIEKFNVKGAPALFAFSEKAGAAVPLASGFVAIDLLEKNTFLIASELIKHEVKQ